MVSIVYGLPAPRLCDKAARGEVLLGGCCVEPDSPQWGCVPCRQRAAQEYVPEFMRE